MVVNRWQPPDLPAASLAALARANGWSALVPLFAGPFISGLDVGLGLAPVVSVEDLRSGLSRLGCRRLE